ncbi:MAG TPA: hypothetical protein VGI82_04160 [Chitinophagaceae bacterium]
MREILAKVKNKILRMLDEGNVQQPVNSMLSPAYHITETEAIACRMSEFSEKRLNLLVPALSIKYAFGGINTAIDFFLHLIQQDTDVRIIITDEINSDLQALADADSWQVVRYDEPDRRGKLITCFGDRSHKTIPVRKQDIFVTTAWWTAYVAKGILKWQQRQWKTLPPPMIYLVQDFEPGFYKWSSRYAMALSTYHDNNLIVIVNTQLLYDYFYNTGFRFKLAYVFEPSLNKTLALFIPEKNKFLKKRRIIFYGRPTVERNGLEILIRGLQMWSEQYANSHEWEVISLGEFYNPIPLLNGNIIHVKGKVSLHEYAELLLTSALGASLMISPHPSYPPLEMAAFDLGVITNSFYNKNLSHYHDNIFSLENMVPEEFAELLCQLCSRFETNTDCFRNKCFHNFNFMNNGNNFGFIPDLRNELKLK